MSEKWGAIGSSIWRSRRFRPLDDFCRSAYLYLHANDHRLSIGLYHLPVLFMADDMNRDPADCRAALDHLVEARLIDYDPETNLLRVRNWEYRNAPSGPKDAIGRITKNFDKSPEHLFTLAAFVAFAQNILHKAYGIAEAGDGWATTEIRAKMESMIEMRMERWAIQRPALLQAAFNLADVDPGDRVFASLWYRVSPTQSAPYRLGMATKDKEKDKEKEKEKEKDKTHRSTPEMDDIVHGLRQRAGRLG